MREPPERTNTVVRNLVQELGGLVAPEDAPRTGTSIEELEKIFAEAEEGTIPWRKLRAMLTPVISSIADGTTQARAAQVSMLRLIIEKAEKQASEEEQVHGVVILPVQGTGATMTIDQQWVEKLKQLEQEADDSDVVPIEDLAPDA
jgi:4-aminobutyrate aminotransferase-like enzyme